MAKKKKTEFICSVCDRNVTKDEFCLSCEDEETYSKDVPLKKDGEQRGNYLDRI